MKDLTEFISESESSSLDAAELKKELLRSCDGVKDIYIREFSDGDFNVTLDYLEPRDWPNGISNNTVCLVFTFRNINGRVCAEYHHSGHIELTPEDRAGKYKHCALKSFTDPYKDKGNKMMRKFYPKTPRDAAKKISEFANAVYAAALEDQGGTLTRKSKN